jgi:hypothetical protein
MLVEDHDRGQVVMCLLCKTAIKVATTPAPPPSGKPSSPRK